MGSTPTQHSNLRLKLPPAWTVLKPHRIQSELWNCRKRFITVAAGRGSGKTELALRKLAICSRVNNGRYFYAGPTIQQAKSVAWDRLVSLIPPQWLLPNSPNKSELTIKTIFGCEIRVVGMDKPQRVEGVQYNGGVLDERADIKPGAFGKSILPALSHHKGWLWSIGVPKRTGIGVREYREAFNKGLVGNPANASFTWTSDTVLPKEIVEEAKEQMDEVTFREQFRATWESAAGGIYHAFDPKVNVRKTFYNPNDEICVSSDFNVNPMCWCLWHNNKKDRVVEVFDEVVLRDTNTPATLTHLHNRYSEHRAGWAFYGDAAGKNRTTNASASDYQIIAQDARFGNKRILYPRKNPLRKDRFATSNALLCNAKGVSRVFIDPKCTKLIDDLSSRTYKEGTCEPDDAADIGHMADAFDYGIFAEYPLNWEQLLTAVPKVGIG